MRRSIHVFLLALLSSPILVGQQDMGTITGYFKGLGMAGPLIGTVTPAGHLQFTVTVLGGSSFLSFDGIIKIGGDITGTFEVLNQQRQFTGESGPWNASSNQ